jgi:hypothetical protein
MPIPPNFEGVLTQTGPRSSFLGLEQRLAVFCAREARLLVCRSPARLGLIPIDGRPVFLSTA